MLNIFYQNNVIKDTLMINLSIMKPTQIVSKNDITYGFVDNNLVFINIFNASKYIDNLQPGLLFPCKELLSKIKKITTYDISNFFNNGFKIGLITECDKIKGTHLHRCKVDVGKENGNEQIIDVICGANNVQANIRVVCALAYTALPNGKIIIPTTILGYQTNAMLCSYNELNIKSKKQGIIVLTKNDDIDLFWDETIPPISELRNYHIGEYFWPAYANMYVLFSKAKIGK